MACRNQQKAEAAAKEVRKEANVADDMVSVEILDLSSFKSVREFAARINSSMYNFLEFCTFRGIFWELSQAPSS